MGVTLTLLSGAAAAQSNAGIRVHMHGVEGYAADGLLYKPSASQPHAALLLIPDERGITQRITDAATTFVNAGYVVVAVDLNRGLSADMATRNQEQVDHDLKSALAFVCSQAHLTSDNVGLVGWGSGSAAALRLAKDAKTRAVALSGVAPLDAYAPVAASRAAILASFASRDTDGSSPLVKEVSARLPKLGKSVEIKIYPDAEGGFDDPEDSAHYKSADAADVRSREMRFFTLKLGS